MFCRIIIKANYSNGYFYGQKNERANEVLGLKKFLCLYFIVMAVLNTNLTN